MAASPSPEPRSPTAPASPTVPTRPSTRALLGTMALVILLLVYVLAATAVAGLVLPNANGLVQLLYYAVAGLAWVPPAGFIISWMYGRPGGVRTPRQP